MLSKNLAFFCNLGYNEDYKKRVIPRVFPSGNFVCFDLFFSGKKLCFYRRKKYEKLWR